MRTYPGAVIVFCSLLGTFACTPEECGSDLHDGGDGRCVAIGTCVAGYHNGGDGICVSVDSCAPGYAMGTGGVCAIPFEIPIPAGSFMRGGVRVAISRPFAMMTTEVTQGLWKQLSGGMGTPSFSDCDGAGGDLCPAEMVDWYAALGFANALSIAEGLSPCYVITGCDGSDWQDGSAPDCSIGFSNVDEPLSCEGYRLPTEAEWEYAYRAGTTTMFYNGDDEAELGEIAWYKRNSYDSKPVVAQKKPNAWGLFDMAGCVSEWIWDAYDDYPPDALTDYTGPGPGDFRVIRGGSWRSDAHNAQADYRVYGRAAVDYYFHGFRLARTLP